MDALEALYTRRSIRQYQSTPVEEEKIEAILCRGMMAPSAGNQQPWHFIVIKDKKMLATLAEVHPYAKMVVHAPAAILACGDLSLERHKGVWVQDLSAATENMLLAAHSLGLGSVWLGVYPREERVAAIAKLFQLPEHIIAFSLIPIGYPAEVKESKSRYDLTRVHRENW